MLSSNRRLTPIPVHWIFTAVLSVGLLGACSSDDGDGGGLTDPPPNNDPANQPPVAVIQSSHDAVPPGDNNQTVVTLDGSGSSDPDGDELSYQWDVFGATYVGGTSSSSEVVQVTFPGVAPYPSTLRVSDGRGGTHTASFTVELR